MTALQRKLAEARAEGRAALVGYYPAGLPDVDSSVRVIEAMVAGEMDMSLFNWTYGGNNGDPDARDTLMTGGANNFSNFSNERVDELLRLGVTEQDEEKRIEIYREIQEIVADEVPFIFLLVFTGFSFYSNSIKGLPDSVLNSDNLYPFIFQLWKEEE